ncbi:MAG: hypothetical protein Fur0022_07010 [Anaerolineales bacterium]
MIVESGAGVSDEIMLSAMLSVFGGGDALGDISDVKAGALQATKANMMVKQIQNGVSLHLEG